jgi:hypothetical protein
VLQKLFILKHANGNVLYLLLYFTVKYWEHFIMNVTIDITPTEGSISVKSGMAWKELILVCFVRNYISLVLKFVLSLNKV